MWSVRSTRTQDARQRRELLCFMVVASPGARVMLGSVVGSCRQLKHSGWLSEIVVEDPRFSVDEGIVLASWRGCSCERTLLKMGIPLTRSD